MKKITFFLFFILSISTLLAQDFYLNTNGVTCMCPDAAVGDSGVVNGITYTKRTKEQITEVNAATTCTSGTIDMNNLFAENESFNEDISSWDTSNVTNMASLFYATSFNQDIGDWDVSKVTNMQNMFLGAKDFNQPIGDWDVSNVIDMSSMFAFNTSFNQDIGDWDVSKVTNMQNMFSKSLNFNQDIGDWDVSNVTNMSFMFGNAFVLVAFNQDLSTWNVMKVNECQYFFASISLYEPIWTLPQPNFTNCTP